MIASAFISGSVANADTGKLTITADNYYTAYINDIELGSNSKDGSGTDNWSTPETYDFDLLDLNTIIVKASNAGGIDGLIASITNNSTGKVIAVTNTDSYWSYSTDDGITWKTPAVSRGSWQTAWGGFSGYSQSGGPLYNAFSNTGTGNDAAQWIWSSNQNDSPVLFKLTFTPDGPAVPEPMSVMLGIMGLGSIAGLKKFRRS